MPRGTDNLSRSLVAVLAATIGVGVVAYFTSPKKAAEANSGATTKSADAAALAHDPAALPIVAIAPPTTGPSGLPPMMSVTPTAISAAPSALVLPTTDSRQPKATVPTTKPSAGGAAVLDMMRVTPGTAMSATWAADAQAKIDANDFITARQILNTALVSGTLSPADVSGAKEKIAKLNDTLVFSARRSPADTFGATYVVQPGDRLAKIADKFEISADMIMRVNGITDARKLRAGQSIKVFKGPFNAVVDKGNFTLEAWLGQPNAAGSMYVKTFKVGLGRDNSTPDGVWQVRPGGKLKNPKFWGAGDLPPMEADDPKNPLGERWIALDGIDGNAIGKQSYGIHGTVDPDSVGKMASMGCIRLKNEDVELVYDLLVDGKSTVVVKN